jgi:hypothetical protein
MGRNTVYKRKKNKTRFFGPYEAFSGVFMASGGQKKIAKYTTGQAKVLVLANILPDAEIGLYSGAVIINSSVNAQPAEIYTGA